MARPASKTLAANPKGAATSFDYDAVSDKGRRRAPSVAAGYRTKPILPKLGQQGNRTSQPPNFTGMPHFAGIACGQKMTSARPTSRLRST